MNLEHFTSIAKLLKDNKKDEATQYILKNKVDINGACEVCNDPTIHKTFYGLSLIDLAAMTGNIPMCNFLIENGATIDSITSEEECALYNTSTLAKATLCGNIEICKLLMEHGADPLYYLHNEIDYAPFVLAVLHEKHQTAGLTSLYFNTLTDKISNLKNQLSELGEDTKELSYRDNIQQNWKLFEAVKRGDLNLCKEAIKKGAHPLHKNYISYNTCAFYHSISNMFSGKIDKQRKKYRDIEEQRKKYRDIDEQRKKYRDITLYLHNIIKEEINELQIKIDNIKSREAMLRPQTVYYPGAGVSALAHTGNQKPIESAQASKKSTITIR